MKHILDIMMYSMMAIANLIVEKTPFVRFDMQDPGFTVRRVVFESSHDSRYPYPSQQRQKHCIA